MTWDDGAACRLSSRPDDWFEVEEAADDDRAPEIAVVAAALSACDACPVRDACLEHGLASRSPGIWGATLAIDREVEYGSGTWRRRFGVRAALAELVEVRRGRGPVQDGGLPVAGYGSGVVVRATQD